MPTAEELKAEYLRRKQEAKYLFFQPNGKQDEFIKKVGMGDKFIYLFITANGVGKDCAAMNILANIFWETKNENFKGLPLFDKWPFPDKHVRIVTESKLVEETGPTDKEIGEWWPRGRYTAHRGGKQYISHYRTDTGFLVDKMTYEQEPEEFEGVNCGAIFFSEPPPEDIFNRCVSRLRRGGIILIYMTPMSNAAWIQDRLLDDKDTCIVTADIEENCATHGRGGVLPHEQIERMMAKWSPDELEARVKGRFMHLSNVILGRAFQRQFHVVKNELEPPQGSQWFLIVDPARGKPWAMGWGWVDLTGRIVFDSEYPLEDWRKCHETKLAIRDYADIIWGMETGKPTATKIIDRHFANSRNDYGTTLKEDLEGKFGLEFQDSYSCENEVETGIEKMKELLRFDDSRPMDSLNQPRLAVKARCQNIIRAMERWDRDPVSLKPNAMSIYKDHFDLARYAAMAGLHVDQPVFFPERKPIYALGR